MTNAEHKALFLLLITIKLIAKIRLRVSNLLKSFSDLLSRSTINYLSVILA